MSGHLATGAVKADFQVRGGPSEAAEYPVQEGDQPGQKKQEKTPYRKHPVFDALENIIEFFGGWGFGQLGTFFVLQVPPEGLRTGRAGVQMGLDASAGFRTGFARRVQKHQVRDDLTGERTLVFHIFFLGSLSFQHTREPLSGPEDPHFDHGDRKTHNLTDLLIRKFFLGGQQEHRPIRFRQREQGTFEGFVLLPVECDRFGAGVGRRERDPCLLQRIQGSHSFFAFDAIQVQIAGNTKQPGLHRRLAPKPFQRQHGPVKSFVGEIIGQGPVAREAKQIPVDRAGVLVKQVCDVFRLGEGRRRLHRMH